ncbi:hypothetical protein [Streptomyces sp. NBC_00887]|uniref:hypothetical protein n=1 Tax=Streptomyces sp. NBC_00887 TaxID=2975859 RepID=UPI003869973E|nr:hypothetical protein OG844_46885 [Streptomyces sp. NBC_00887]
MDTSQDDLRCGLCGQTVNPRHEQHHEEPVVGSTGKRVEYVVVELRGASALFQAADAPSRIRQTGAADLAEQLEIDLPDLLGRHYTCWETPGEYGGVFRSGFQLA